MRAFDILPALPIAWPEGRVRGLKARGNITVDISWKDGRVTDYQLSSPNAQKVRVRVNGEEKELDIPAQKD